MKRCPQCNRVESDDSLAYCRVDGSPLRVTASIGSEELGTIRLDSRTGSGEMATTMLPPQAITSETPIAAITQTSQAPLKKPQTRELSKPKNRKPLIIAVALIVVTAVVVCAYFLLSKKKKIDVPIQSIAVMPFVNDSGNTDIDYLADGMTETLISSLSQLTNLTVKARSSVFRYKGKETNPQAIGKELNVQAVLNGRLAQRGDQLSLTLELVDAQTENVIWSEQYNRPQNDLVKLQTEIARDVSSKLSTKLSGAEAQKLARTYTSNPEAYRLYLQGRFYWNKREDKDARTAIDSFNKAINLDANYALAYAGLADAYVLLGSFNFAPPTEAIPKARGYALKALSLDETLAEPHATLGLANFQFDYDLASAEREYKRAIELNPNYATAHQWYGELLTASGRVDEADAEYRKALALEPLSLPVNWDYGRFLYMARRFDEAIAQHKKTLDLDPGFARARRTLVEIYRAKKDHANAGEELVRYFEARGQTDNAALIRERLANGGWPALLQLVVEENSPLNERNSYKAKAYAELGDLDNAFYELSAGFDSHDSGLIWLKADPLYDSLRSDPRYQVLMQKMRFQ